MSILNDVKTTLDFASEEDTGFDSRLIMELDGIIGELSQLTFVNNSFVMNTDAEWKGLLDIDDQNLLRLVKQFIYINIRLKFDPPAGSVLTSLEKSLQSTAHRIIIQKEKFNDPERLNESRTTPRD
jgi:hypothetical protein|uniref:Uncharacterized protein n=1 Tax=Siphoviridae sp. ctWKa2 TaxID=2825537 RepID=A0A8S5PF73_9CAUD|nr:MAG TPA: hypothetical protein [Siphoviridae sp. ctWKa2]DAS78322.1 MAG TPA: hypothetical protein [Caudoviricetes sp.]